MGAVADTVSPKEDRMIKARLGRTNLEVTKDALGVLPLQRVVMDEAVHILRKALDGGINFFDTARGYSDSEEKIGAALSSRREEFVLATKSPAKKGEDLKKDLAVSLEKLKTNYIDIYQFYKCIQYLYNDNMFLP